MTIGIITLTAPEQAGQVLGEGTCVCSSGVADPFLLGPPPFPHLCTDGMTEHS